MLLRCILLIIISILLIVLVYKMLVVHSDTDKFADTTIPTHSALYSTMGDVLDYAKVSGEVLDETTCTSSPDNMEKNVFPQVFCLDTEFRKRAKLGNLISSYVSAEVDLIGGQLGGNQTTLEILNQDKDAYINRSYVADFLEYTKSSPPPITSGTLELFGDVPSVARQNSVANASYKFPSVAGDFYGTYKIDRAQFHLIDGITIHLDYNYLRVYDLDAQMIYQYQVQTMDKVEFNKMPTTTIIITLINNPTTGGNISEEKQKKINLLRDLGLNGSSIYLYGNNGSYSLYNYYKTLMFKLIRMTQE
jgi:hypothetical protein